MRLEELARLRQLAYRLFSSTLLYPDERRLKTIAAAAAELRGASRAVVKFAFFPQWQRLLTVLAEPPGHASLGEEYVRVFLHSPDRDPCLLYESAYVDPEGQAAGWVLALLEQEYAAAGLALSPSLKEMPDHAAVELEFMAFLCGQEADAWDREIIEDGVQALERQGAFLDRHLARWVPQWARRVASADDDGIYWAVAEATRTFMSHDQDLLRILLDKYRRVPAGARAGPTGKGALRKQRHSGSHHRVP